MCSFLYDMHAFFQQKSVEIPTTNLKCVVPMWLSVFSFASLSRKSISHSFTTISLRFCNYFERECVHCGVVVDAISSNIFFGILCEVNIFRKFCRNQNAFETNRQNNCYVSAIMIQWKIVPLYLLSLTLPRKHPNDAIQWAVKNGINLLL